ncbi:MAG TPA: hypothetical protein ENK10_05750 [Acidobacteria bacterium]|nr:hypothetical protein [Acidobacteriota bacterium]
MLVREWIESGPEAGAIAMEADRALLEASDFRPGTGWRLRVHGWAGPTLTLGRGQRPSVELSREAESCGVEVVVRPTGGGWLLHLPGDLALSAAFPGPLGRGDLRGSARAVGELIVRALAVGGLPAHLVSAATAAASPATRAEVCFQRADREEVTIDQVKAAGVALARIRGAVLIQSAIPLIEPPAGLVSFARRWDPARAAAVEGLAGLDYRLLTARLGQQIQVGSEEVNR